MARFFISLIALLFIALFLSGSFKAEGVVRGSMVQGGRGEIVLGPGRLFAWGTCEFRPGKIYYKLAVS